MWNERGRGDAGTRGRGDTGTLRVSASPRLRVQFALAALLFSIHAPAAEPWWSTAWAYRRPLLVTENVRGSDPLDVAIAEIPTLGKTNPSGSDLRVIDKTGNEMKHAVLASNFEDRIVLAFEAPYRGPYMLYFGNSTALEPKQRLVLRAGVTLEAREMGIGYPNSWAAMEKLYENSPHVEGRRWWPGLEVDFNPFGAWTHGIFVFNACVNCPVDGKYTFASTAQDASFILVDNKLVVDWGGWKGRKQVRKGDIGRDNTGKIELKAGPHQIKYVNAFDGHGATLAGWQKPGDRGLTPIPQSAFVGYYVAHPGGAESQKGPLADFTWSIEDDLGMEARMPTLVQFDALTRGKDFKWDFGDGVVGFDPKPEHVYLEPGTYTVRCEIGGKTAVQKIAVRPMHGHRNKQYEKRIGEYATIIKDYPATELSPAACFEMAQICHEAGNFAAAATALRGMFEKGSPPDADEIYWYTRLYEIYREDRKFDDCLWVAGHMLETAKSPERAAYALNLKAEILFDYKDDLDAANKCCKTVLAKYSGANSDQVRMAFIRMGEYALLRGDKTLGRKTLDDAQHADQWQKWKGDMDVTEGAHDLNAEQYIKSGDFDAALKEVRLWEWQTPTIMLSGQTRFVRGRVFAAKHDYPQALREFERALSVAPRAPFADEVLLQKAQCYETLKEQDKARDCYTKLIADFPESKLVAAAKEKLK